MTPCYTLLMDLASCKHKAVCFIQSCIRKSFISSPTVYHCRRCWSSAKEYHHHRGYDIENWADVIPVCTVCHKWFHNKNPKDKRVLTIFDLRLIMETKKKAAVPDGLWDKLVLFTRRDDTAEDRVTFRISGQERDDMNSLCQQLKMSVGDYVIALHRLSIFEKANISRAFRPDLLNKSSAFRASSVEKKVLMAAAKSMDVSFGEYLLALHRHYCGDKQ